MGRDEEKGIDPANENTKEIPLDAMDIITTNPPFGSDIPITDKHILEQYELAHNWEHDGEGGFRNNGVLRGSVAPEILFIEPKQHTGRIRICGRFGERTLTRSEKIEDNYLPVIAAKYREFLKEHDG